MNDQETVCRACGSTLNEAGHGSDSYQYDCPNCGRFVLNTITRSMVLSRVNNSYRFGAILSHAIRKMQRHTEWPQISSEVVKKIEKEATLPDVIEQAENLVLWLGDNLKAPGSHLHIIYANHRAILGALHSEGVLFIVNELERRGTIHGEHEGTASNITLTFEGWELYHRLKRHTTSGYKAFMAMDFKNSTLDKVFLEHFKPAAAKAGFELVRLNEKPKAGSIDERLRVEIRCAKFLVVDLTDANPGAYWEAGFAEALGKPVIYTCEKKIFKTKGTHFDTNHLHTVLWEPTSPEEAEEELKNTIRATLPDEAKMSDD